MIYSSFMLGTCNYFVKLALHWYCGDNVWNADFIQGTCLKAFLWLCSKKPTTWSFRKPHSNEERLWKMMCSSYYMEKERSSKEVVPITYALGRRSQRRCSITKGVLKNFVKFTGKYLCRSFFFNYVACLPANLLKKKLWHRCFPVNLAKFLRRPFFTEYIRTTASKLGRKFFTAVTTLFRPG